MERSEAMSQIFISYRRDDSGTTADRIYDSLVAYFGRNFLFKDVNSIPYGARFPQFIDDTLKDCRVVLAIIGPRWLEMATSDGARRLDDPADWVRVEVETALRRNVTIIPVLVEGAQMPGANRLPESMRPLAEMNALQVRRDPDYHTDMMRLIQTMERQVIGSAQASAEAAKYAPKDTISRQYLIWGLVALAILLICSLVAGASFLLPLLIQH
jgi:TIR domain-containing protein